MSQITIELEDKTAKKLRLLAKAKGVSLEKYLKGLAEDKVEIQGKTKPSVKQKLKAFDVWVASFPQHAHGKLDDSRESIYEGRKL